MRKPNPNPNMQKSITMRTKWSECNMKDFFSLEKLLTSNSILPEVKVQYAIAILSDEEPETIGSLPMGTFQKLAAKLDFLKTPPAKKIAHSTIVSNGHKYNVTLDLSKLSVAQYFDFSTFMKTYQSTSELEDLCAVFAVFLIPEGHEYNDGYDIEQVRTDMKTLKVEEALAVTDFFQVLFRQYMRSMLRSLKAQLRKSNSLTPELHQKMKELEKNLKRSV